VEGWIRADDLRPGDEVSAREGNEFTDGTVLARRRRLRGGVVITLEVYVGPSDYEQRQVRLDRDQPVYTYRLARRADHEGYEWIAGDWYVPKRKFHSRKEREHASYVTSLEWAVCLLAVALVAVGWREGGPGGGIGVLILIFIAFFVLGRLAGVRHSRPESRIDRSRYRLQTRTGAEERRRDEAWRITEEARLQSRRKWSESRRKDPPRPAD